MAGNASSMGQGVYDASQNGLTVKNSLQILAGGAGLGGNAAGKFGKTATKNAEQVVESITDASSSGTKAVKETAEQVGKNVEATTGTVDLFETLRDRNLSQLTRQEVGDIGEDVARRLLGENGFTDIMSIQNRSGNGIDTVARASDGRLVFFEVKASRVGEVGNLSTRQQSMTSFIEDVLGQASTGTGRYRDLAAATQDIARQLLREFRRNPLNVSGNAVGVDLLNEILRISPWR